MFERSTNEIAALLVAGLCMAGLYHWIIARPEDRSVQELRKYLRGYPVVQAVALDIGCAILAVILLRRLFA